MRIAVAALLLLCVCSRLVAAEREVVVGVYQNAPKITADADGQPSGILGDLLGEIARSQQWQLKPVQCDWAYCLQLLQAGEIDLLPDVAYTEQRALQLDFHETPALYSWSQLYTAPGVSLNSIEQLAGKTVLVLQDSVQQHYLQRWSTESGIAVQLSTVRSMPEAFALLSAGQAEVVAANHYFGQAQRNKYNLTQSNVIFQPSRLFYATKKGYNQDLLTVIETRLAQWQSNASSPYYQVLQRWGTNTPQRQVPQYVWLILAMLSSLLLLALAGAWWLKRQVSDKTRHLQVSEDRLNTILNSVDAHIYIKDIKGRYQYVNRKVAQLFGCEPAEAVGRRDDAFFDAASSANIQQNDQKVLQLGERLVEEEYNTSLDGEQSHTFLSVKLPLRDNRGHIYALCGISTDITELKQHQQEIHQLAFYDVLTGLPNRRMVLERLKHAVEFKQRQTDSAQGALLFIDLDHFKDLNDSLGHAMGDQLLQQVAQRLQTHLRKVDTLARLGGDEFVVLLTDLHPDIELSSQKASLIGEKIVQLLAEPFELQERPYTISASVGVAMFSDGCNSDELLQRADLAMYDAKDRGRNGVRFFNQQMQADVSSRADIVNGLRLALAQQQFVLHFQPQLQRDAGVVGAEVLIRWQHPTEGMIAPAHFIPVAESSGQIQAIGRWVLQQSCHQLAEWARWPETANWYLAVNISARQLHSSGFVAEVSKVLQDSGARPQCLVLEITESQLLQDIDSVIAKMQQLTALGVRFSLDDFGTGYSSLSYLKRLPLRQLKIDRSFVRDILTDPNDKAIIKTILALGQSLELAVIAEGVETDDQYQKLLQLGCQQFQGYYFGKPESLDVFMKNCK
ncbi:EAL domain-containing protein [Rheinheimera maricola]|uniref:EAL domain-containing protein n=1 Tax=Rheinheimera maricola TaxID=2793282 RepID=A0ABS7X7U4_9GAMM|nr:EAL domain-containing protein [Rheinheimera maricola]MBZ9611621.1 EAL domain-containing protein [Rheinheimera maricola]